MVQPTAHRAIPVALVLLACGLAAGTAVADDGPHWFKHHTHPHGHGSSGGTSGKDHGADDHKTTASTTTTSTTTTTAPSTSTSTTTTPATAPATSTDAAALAPQLGRRVALATTTGTVLVRPPGADPAPLTTAQALPTGTRVDTRHGTVALTSAIDAKGTTQTGRFSGGVFEVRQAAHGYALLVLVGGHWATCAKTTASAAYVGARARAAKKQPPIRRLWGSDHHGRFQTRGGGSVATVRGTRWLTEDSCAGTRTTVAAGAVAVRSRRTGKTVVVSAGQSFFAKR